MWKKIMISVVAIVSVGVGTVYAESSLPTVYHVYIEGDHAGTVENKETVQSYLQERMLKAEHKYKDWDLSFNEEISFEKQKVLSVKDETDEVLQSLDNDLTLAVDVVRVHVNGEPVANLPNEEQAGEVIDSLKKEYVEEEALEKVEHDQVEPPEVGETEVMDVQLSGTVKMEEDQVTPSQVNTVDEAVSRIEEGRTFQSAPSSIQPLNAKLTDTKGPLLDVIVTKKERLEETIGHKVEIKKTDELYKGESKVKQSGEDGKKEFLIERMYRNGKEVKEETLEEERTKEPVKKIILKGTKQAPSKGTGNFSWPAVGGEITSKQGERWGRMHKGIDISGVSDKTIKAADNGKVVEAGFRKSFGNKVVIDHGNGYETIYAHLSSISVKEGQTVKQGGKLGVMGSTGRSTGVHLHFEIHKDGSLKNPLSYVSP
ncbi:peptidoglycan DD-metalloendopeptidase family protein [Halobacillus karajensis]|uniref:Murein hydrolase activator NlpD n=1 Tax=Halobacillus karajensis TaxID=195088 RepID=A0A059NYY9_9BACI|nr:peptidoglycan DD-metalloendopeptidase family protein [Halobacillus karajensis]CDQ18437.1 Murein hydrolase activator NlpD precursor [Halobacillus karajensis]CDQ23491.1 Murein hydrolase activator NlpD precursor [Halobacillus karajensis]CDQ26973.1 Murein hydrolase activator NlpD precursor [Halobacillus karajensis]